MNEPQAPPATQPSSRTHQIQPSEPQHTTHSSKQAQDNDVDYSRRASNKASTILIELFAGAAGASVVSHNLSSNFDAVYMFELEDELRATLQRHYPHAIIMDDILKLLQPHNSLPTLLQSIIAHHGSDKRYLITGGFPCQDLSKANKHGQGLLGARSGLFAPLAVIVATLMKEAEDSIFFIENVPPREPHWRGELDRVFGVDSFIGQAHHIMPTLRTRLIWTNVTDLTMPAKTQQNKSSILDKGWISAPTALGFPGKERDRWATFTRPFGPGGPPEWKSGFTHLSLRTYVMNNLVVKADINEQQKQQLIKLIRDSDAFDPAYDKTVDCDIRGRLVTYINDTNHTIIRPLNGRERARALGYPYHKLHTQPDDPQPFSDHDWKVIATLGNAWPIPLIQHLMQQFVPQFVSGQNVRRLPVEFPHNNVKDIMDNIKQPPHGRR